MKLCLLEEPPKLLGHSAGVYPGLLNGVLGRLVHLLRRFTA